MIFELKQERSFLICLTIRYTRNWVGKVGSNL